MTIFKGQGVAIVLAQDVAANLIDYQLVSEKILQVTLDLDEGSLTIFQVYAP